jgi:hypothetical protein
VGIPVILKDKETLEDLDTEDNPVLKFLNVGTGLQDSILELEATNDASLRSHKFMPSMFTLT